jgi:hypothetical protein
LVIFVEAIAAASSGYLILVVPPAEFRRSAASRTRSGFSSPIAQNFSFLLKTKVFEREAKFLERTSREAGASSLPPRWRLQAGVRPGERRAREEAQSFPGLGLLTVNEPSFSIGTAAAIVPLSISGIPYFGRVSEAALREVDRGLIEAVRAMGGGNWTIIREALVPEALPRLIARLSPRPASPITIVGMIGELSQ